MVHRAVSQADACRARKNSHSTHCPVAFSPQASQFGVFRIDGRLQLRDLAGHFGHLPRWVRGHLDPRLRAGGDGRAIKEAGYASTQRMFAPDALLWRKAAEFVGRTVSVSFQHLSAGASEDVKAATAFSQRSGIRLWGAKSSAPAIIL